MTRKENALAYIRRKDYEWVPEPEELTLRSKYMPVLDVPVCERPMNQSGYDVFGVHWTSIDGAPSHYTIGQPAIYDDIEDWQSRVRFPDIEKLDWEQMRRDAAALDPENQIISVVLFNGPFERTTVLTPFEDCLCNIIEDPEDFSDLIGAIADHKIRVINKIFEVCKPDLFLYHDDWGTAKSPFMNPELWREVIKPHTKRVYDAIHAHGAVVIQHSCGNVTPMVPDMVEMGADGWDGQPSCNDIPALKERFDSRFYFMLREVKLGAAPPRIEEKYGGYPEVPEFLFK